jgi:hypothetical protein
LAAHRENVEGRNGDFAKIIQQTLFLEKGANDVASGVDTTDAIRKYVHGKVGGKEGRRMRRRGEQLMHVVGDFWVSRGGVVGWIG